MVAIIKAHNRLNGIKFSIGEFVLMLLAVGPFAIYYLVHQEFLLAFIAWGITLNFLPVLAFGIRQLLDKKQEENKNGTMWDKKAREKLMLEHPHMLKDTLLLVGAILLPFVALAITLYEILKSRIQHKD